MAIERVMDYAAQAKKARTPQPPLSDAATRVGSRPMYVPNILTPPSTPTAAAVAPAAVTSQAEMVRKFTPLSPGAASFSKRPSVGPVAPSTAGVIEDLASPQRLSPSVVAAPVAVQTPAVDVAEQATGQGPTTMGAARPATVPRLLSRSERQAAADASTEMTSGAALGLAQQMAAGRFFDRASQTGNKRYRDFIGGKNITDEASKLRWQDAYNTAIESAMSPQQLAQKRRMENQRAVEQGANFEASPEGIQSRRASQEKVDVAREQGAVKASEEARAAASDSMKREREDRMTLYKDFTSQAKEIEDAILADRGKDMIEAGELETMRQQAKALREEARQFLPVTIGQRPAQQVSPAVPTPPANTVATAVSKATAPKAALVSPRTLALKAEADAKYPATDAASIQKRKDYIRQKLAAANASSK
jgi:hypothetical protein